MIQKKLKESVLDIPRKSVNENIIDLETKKLQEYTRYKLLYVLSEFVSLSGLDIEIMGFYLVGSILSKKYGSRSDVDAHIVIDEEDIVNKNKSLKTRDDWVTIRRKTLKKMTNKYKIDKYPIQLYFEPLELGVKETNIYDIFNDKWVISSEVYETLPTEDFISYRKVAREQIHSINDIISDVKSDLMDYEDILVDASDMEMGEIDNTYKQWIMDFKKYLENNLLKNYIKIENIMNDIYEARSVGLTQQGYISKGNILYKFFEKYGIKEELKVLRNEIEIYIEKIEKEKEKELKKKTKKPDTKKT